MESRRQVLTRNSSVGLCNLYRIGAHRRTPFLDLGEHPSAVANAGSRFGENCRHSLSKPIVLFRRMERPLARVK
jgi:hypothetical protein